MIDLPPTSNQNPKRILSMGMLLQTGGIIHSQPTMHGPQEPHLLPHGLKGVCPLWLAPSLWWFQVWFLSKSKSAATRANMTAAAFPLGYQTVQSPGGLCFCSCRMVHL